MTHEVVAQDRVTWVAWTGGVLSWLLVGAAFSVVAAAYEVGIWANHWYIAETVYYAPYVDEVAKEGPYWDITQLLRSGNEALVNGFGWLGVTVLCLVVAVVVRRRRAR